MSKEKLKEYLNIELTNIKTPNSDVLIVIDNLDFKIDLLFDFLEFKINYNDLDRTGDNFFKHLKSPIIDNDISNIESEIESLATNIEAFLKKIAFLKYSNTFYWEGNNEIKGIKNTMFARLCNGTIEPHRNKKEIKIPEQLINNTGIEKEIFDFVRDNIRNSIHKAKKYSRSELFYFLNLVITCYLKAIENNIYFIKTKILPEFIYLENVINEKSYFNIDKFYVELIGKELEDIEMMGVEIADERNLLNNIDNYDILFDEDDEVIKNIDELRVDSILSIVEDIPNLIIIGPPGTGKTTTLQKILFNNSKKIIDGNENLRIPFYVAANEYGKDRTFISILNSKINEVWVNKSLKNGRIQLLIDGINEVHNDYKYLALKEITDLKNNYPNVSIIITDRKFGFENFLEYPVFELKELSTEQIKEFVYKYLTNNKDKIWENLSINESMLSLGKNPLMLKMILLVIKENSIPENRGQLYQLFINTIFLREDKKKKQIDRDVKTNLLSKIAFKMRSLGRIIVNEYDFLGLVNEVIEESKVKISPILFQKEILDNYIVRKSNNNDIAFLHETYQEFFCALYLNEFFEINKEIEIDLGNPIWVEPLIICGELIKKEDSKVSFFRYLFRGQKEPKKIKPFSEFNSEDVNKHLFVASSFAQKNKYHNNEIYILCETYINNYLVLSKKNYINNNNWLIPLENIFTSISILDSKKLLEKIFLDIDWVEIWIHNTDKNLFNILSNELVNNTKNLNNILEILKFSTKEFDWLPNVVQNLNQLKNNILQNSTVDNLVKYYYYDSELDNDVLLTIIQKDYNFIINYSFNNNENKRNIKVLRALIKYHHKKEICRNVFINEIKTKSYNLRFTKYFVDLFFNLNYYKEFLDLMEFIYDENYYLYVENIEKLQILPIDIIGEKLKKSFIQKVIDNKIPIYEIDKNNPNQVLIESCYFDILKAFEFKKLKLNEKFEIESIKISFNHVSNYVIFSGIPLNPEMNNDIPSVGKLKFNISNIEYYYEYQNYNTSKKGDKINFILDTNFQHLNLLPKTPFTIDDTYEFIYTGSSIDKEKTNKINVILKSKQNLIFNETDNYLLLEKNYDINYENYKLYHMSALMEIKIIENIKKDLLKNNTYQNEHILKFIKKTGITYLFENELNNLNYGIIVYLNNSFLKLYLFNEKKIIEHHLKPFENINFKEHDFIIFEENSSIKKTNCSSKLEILFIESEIININYSRNEGFILYKNKTKVYDSDYFFHFQSCNFLPSIGDNVKFLPTSNPSTNHLNQPLAIKISKIERPTCKITEYRKDNNYQIYGKAIDNISNELLFFSFKENLLKILNKSMDLCIEDEFEYSIIKEANNDLLKIIKFIRKI